MLELVGLCRGYDFFLPSLTTTGLVLPLVRLFRVNFPYHRFLSFFSCVIRLPCRESVGSLKESYRAEGAVYFGFDSLRAG